MIHGLEALGDRSRLADVVAGNAIDEAIITIAEPSGRLVRELTELSRRSGIGVRIVSGVHELLGGKVTLSRLRCGRSTGISGRPSPTGRSSP